jgi:hypothetical protein
MTAQVIPFPIEVLRAAAYRRMKERIKVQRLYDPFALGVDVMEAATLVCDCEREFGDQVRGMGE